MDGGIEMNSGIIRFIFVVTLVLCVSAGLCIADDIPGFVYKDGVVRGKMVDAGFDLGDSNYHAVIQASDGNVYYVICSHNRKSGARMFRYDPRTDNVDMIGDLTDVVGEDRTKVVNQGKVHSDFYEVDGKLYFGTHAGAWDETYPGGHFMSYDLASGTFEDYGIGVAADGLVAMTMDRGRGRMYAVTWPGYLFMYYDITTGEKKVWGKRYAPVEQQGPRSIAVDPRTGNAYWHNTDDTIECYYFDRDIVKTLDSPRFDGAMFLVPFDAGGYSVNHVWRSIRWSDAMQKFYGVMYNTDWLFSFEPMSAELEIIDRIASAPNRKSGALYYSSLGFELSDDGETVYYIAGNYVASPDSTEKKQELHLVTYSLSHRRYIDHGVIELDDGRRPRYCQGLEIGTDGNLYIVGWVPAVEKPAGKESVNLGSGGQTELAVEKSKKRDKINLIVLKDPLKR